MATLKTILGPLVVVLTGLSACGGGDGGSSVGPISSGSGYVAGTYMPSAQFKDQCASPRSGSDPVTGRVFTDRSGTTLTEQLWLRSWSNELYLWYSEIPDLNPAGYTVLSYFDALKTSALTSTNRPKDKFHFTYLTSDWEALSQSGTTLSYGIEFASLKRSTPRQLNVAFVEPNAPAKTVTSGIARGAQILTVDGADFVNATDQASIDKINAGLSPAVDGSLHTFSILDAGASTARSVTLQAAKVTSTPVQNVKTIDTPTGKIGYMLFNDHIATAESLLITAISQLKNANINDLVLDIRYNGGGYLDIASELAYMIAGAARTNGLTFERVQFNGKNASTTNPVTGQLLTPTPFLNVSQGFSGISGQALPTLNLSTVYVLTSGDTCSASEAIINGLRGVGVTVVQVGSTTCGKPYGFYPQDNCGTTYFTIEFKGVNAAGFGDYTDGFSPQNSTVLTNVSLPGCSVADDFTHALGDPLEARLAAALSYRMNATCPVASGFAPRAMPMSVDSAADTLSEEGLLMRSPLRENRWYR